MTTPKERLYGEGRCPKEQAQCEAEYVLKNYSKSTPRIVASALLDAFDEIEELRENSEELLADNSKVRSWCKDYMDRINEAEQRNDALKKRVRALEEWTTLAVDLDDCKADTAEWREHWSACMHNLRALLPEQEGE